MKLKEVRKNLIRMAICVGCFIGILTLRISFPAKLLSQSVTLYFVYPAFTHCSKKIHIRRGIKAFMLISVVVGILNGIGIIESSGDILKSFAYVAGASLLFGLCFSWQKYDEQQNLEKVFRAAYQRYTSESWEALPYEQFKESNLLNSEERKEIIRIKAGGFVDIN